MDGLDAHLLRGGGKADVEAGVIDGQKQIGLPAGDLALRVAEEAEEEAEAPQDREEADDGNGVAVEQLLLPGGAHGGAADAAEDYGARGEVPQGAHERRGMLVA